ncbi:glutamate 5-kinase [Candidatus Woesearchaeota archaeon]|nr:glutamate 5-kinase [Candidatus Woesearchaeota archaeon]
MKQKRIVIKLGTNTLTTEKGSLDSGYFSRIAEEIVQLKNDGHDIIIVSSGAIGAGKDTLHISGKIQDIILRQACAAIGQDLLMKMWRQVFSKYNINVAQLLLTYDSFVNRKVYLNLTESLNKLLELGVIPIINENDAISTQEIDASFGDNDKLSALVASKIDADILILLSDIEGLYTSNPKEKSNFGKKPELIREVQKITPEIERMGGKASIKGTGGMKTKLDAAKLCSSAGVEMVITHGRIDHVLRKVLVHEVGTRFVSSTRISQKERWINLAPVKGKIIVDEGAFKALKEGKSLLPAGVIKVEGVFEKNEVVELVCSRSFGKAISDYSSIQLEKIKGKKGEKIVFKRENFVWV